MDPEFIHEIPRVRAPQDADAESVRFPRRARLVAAVHSTVMHESTHASSRGDDVWISRWVLFSQTSIGPSKRELARIPSRRARRVRRLHRAVGVEPGVDVGTKLVSIVQVFPRHGLVAFVFGVQTMKIVSSVQRRSRRVVVVVEARCR